MSVRSGDLILPFLPSYYSFLHVVSFYYTTITKKRSETISKIVYNKFPNNNKI